MKIKYLFIVAVIGLLQSCVTEKNCNKKFPPHEIETKSIHDSISIKYVSVTIPKDSIIFKDSIPCKEFTLDFSEKKKNITASLNIKNGKVTFKCSEDSLKAVISEITKHRTIKNNKVEIKTEIQYLKHWYNTFCIWFTIITLVLLVLLLIFLYISKSLGN